MSLPDREYKGLMALACGLLYDDSSRRADRFFYLDIIEQSGQPVLEVGCGAGRLLLDYLGQGIDIDGLDYSPESLAICRARAAGMGLTPTLFAQSMETISLPRNYRTILVPSGSLQRITELEAVSHTMARLHAHLQPGGVLVASVKTLWKEGDPLESTREKSIEREDGVVARRVSRSRYDPATQCEHTNDIVQLTVEGKVVAQEQRRRLPAIRSYTQSQARTIFIQAGFSAVTLFRESSFDLALPDDTKFVVAGWKAGSSFSV